jgi:hypothetical protein
MNSLFRLLLVMVLLAGTAFAQSLGEVARENRQTKRKPAARVYTNDDLPSKSSSADSSAEESDATAKKSDVTKKDSADKSDQKADTGKSDEALKKVWEGYKTRVTDQKAKIDLLQRELDVLQKEKEVHDTSSYYDAGARLRDSKAFTEKQQKYIDDIDAKTKTLQDAKDGLDTLLDEARKANVPSSYLE